MKVVGIFANLTLNSRDSVDFHTRQYVDALARRGVEWSLLLFSKSEAKEVDRPLPGRLTMVRSSKNFAILAMKAARDAAFWLLTGQKIGLLRRLAEEVDRVQPDIIFIDGLPLAPLIVAFRGRPSVLTCVDAMSLRHYRFLKRARSIVAWLDSAVRAISCEMLERCFLSRFSVVHVVSSTDAEYLQHICLTARIRQAPIIAPIATRPPLPESEKHRRQMVIWGDVGVGQIRTGIANFLARVRPLLGADAPDLVVLGRRKPDQELKRLLDKWPGVTFSAWATDLNALLAQSGAVILPDDSGTGIKNRTVHAMALGVVVIGSPAALEGVPVEDGVNALVCRNEKEFAATIVRAGVASASVLDLERNAVRLVEDYFSEEVVSQKWLTILREALESGRVTA